MINTRLSAPTTADDLPAHASRPTRSNTADVFHLSGYSQTVIASAFEVDGKSWVRKGGMGNGTPDSFPGKAGDGRVKTVLPWHINIAGNPLAPFVLRFRKRYNEEFDALPAKTAFDMWIAAVERAGTFDPLKVASALENMRHQGPTGEVWMRPDDHQLQLPLYIATFTKVGGEVKYDLEDTGYGFRTDMTIEPKDSTLPTTCRRERP